MTHASPNIPEQVTRMLRLVQFIAWYGLISVAVTATFLAAIRPSQAATRTAHHSPYLAAQHAASSDINYTLQWGVDSMQAHQTNAGNLIRFSYRVLDTNKAKLL